MNERVLQFRVGVFVLAAILVAVILMLAFVGSNPLFKGGFTINVRFSDAPGVTRGTPVRKAGIRIGQVRSVTLGNNDQEVDVLVDIEGGHEIYSNEQCVVRTSLLGDAYLDWVKNPNYHGVPTVLPRNQVVVGVVPQEITSSSVADLNTQAKIALNSIRVAADDIHALVGENKAEIKGLVTQTTDTMGALQQSLTAAKIILDDLGDPKLRKQINDTVEGLSRSASKMDAAFSKMDVTFDLVNKDLEDIRGLTKPLGEHGETIVGEASASIHKLNLLSENLLRFSQQAEDPNGSLGALLHDRELYNRINRLVENVDGLTRDLKPVIHNVEVFSDKIARHPSVLGVGGAIRKDSGLKDVPTDENGQPVQPQQARRWPLSGGGSWGVGQGR